MNFQDFQILSFSIVGIFAALGGGVKWLTTHLDAKQDKAALAESEARTELSNRLHEEIRVLRIELADMRAEKRLYLRRILQLEAFIHAQPGMAIPLMDGWPPA